MFTGCKHFEIGVCGVSFLYEVGYCFALTVAFLALPFSRKIRRGIWGRVGLLKRIKRQCISQSEKTLWFHVASSGEFEQCLPVLEAVKRKAPTAYLFLSFFSPTAYDAISLEAERRRKAGVPCPWDYADYSPFDLSFSVTRFLKQLKPTHFVAIHREIWPTLLRRCRRHNVKTHLFSSYFPPQKQKKLPFYLKRWLTLFDYIGTVDTHGDPRIDRVIQRKAMRKSVPPWRHFFENQEIFVLASLWKKDFVVISPALANLLQSSISPRLLIAPHEPSETFVRYLSEWFKKSGIPARRWSHWLYGPDTTSHLIIDKVGELAELYSLASFAFVGGSFRARVHNVLEPAVYGKPILVGPHIQNSAEAVELSHIRSGLICVNDRSEFLCEARALLEDGETRRKHSESLIHYINNKAGASEKYATVLLE